MEHQDVQSDICPDEPQGHQRWQLRAGPMGSPFEVPRTPDNQWPSIFVPCGIPIDPLDISPELTNERLTPASTPQKASKDAAVFIHSNGGGNLSFQSTGKMRAHANEVTQAIRRSLSTANEQMEAMLREHLGHVTSLEAQLADAREGKTQLRQQAAESSLQSSADGRRMKTLKKDLYRAHSTSQHLRARVRCFERKYKKAADERSVLRAEKERLETKLADQTETIPQATRNLKQAEARIVKLREVVKKPTQAFVFIQSGRRNFTTWYDHDVSFRVIREDYAYETDQSSSRLVGRLQESTEELELDEVFTIRPKEKTWIWIICVEVVDRPLVKRRRMAYVDLR